jgi:hypothetical protein
MFETSSHSALLEKTGVRQLISDILDELIQLATAHGCKFDAAFKDSVIKEQCKPSENTSIMWQDYVARRPMEVETYLGSPIKLAQATGIKLPRIETLYAIFHNLNVTNQSRPRETNGMPAVPGSPSSMAPTPRMAPNGLPPRVSSNGLPPGMPSLPNGRPGRPRNSSNYTGPPVSMRRPPPGANGGGPPNGYRPMNGGPNGYGSRQPSRRGSMEDDLGEFSHLVLYDDLPMDGEGQLVGGNSDIAMRERELQLRQREMALKEQEMRMRRGPPPRRRGPPPSRGGGGGMYDDDDEEDDYFDPNSAPINPMVDAENFDMMSVTSRKNRAKVPPNQGQIRNDPEMGGGMARNSRFGPGRPGFGRNRSSQLMNSLASPHDNVLDDPMMAYTSNRYGTVDRGQMHHTGSRANSLTAQHLDQIPGGMPPGPFPRRTSHSPGNPYSPSVRGANGRPSPPNGIPGPGMHGHHMNGRPSPPDGMRQPIPRYPPGQGNIVAPQQVEQHAGVSPLQPPQAKNIRSLTGSASASAGSGDSANLESEPSASSSQSSLGPRGLVRVQ